MKKLDRIVKEIENNIEFHENVNKSVSQVSVGWQLEHMMLVIANVVAALEKSNRVDYKLKYKAIRFFIMATGKIPRGKGRAPKGVTPVEETARTIENLNDQLEKVRMSVLKLAKLDKHNFFTHPYFGNMKRDAAIKFLRIHSNHHLKIVHDILKETSKKTNSI